jgi:hypothetical protein
MNERTKIVAITLGSDVVRRKVTDPACPRAGTNMQPVLHRGLFSAASPALCSDLPATVKTCRTGDSTDSVEAAYLQGFSCSAVRKILAAHCSIFVEQVL